MLELLKEATNKTFTENGAVTLASTGSECLDLFATIGAIRRRSDDEIILRFSRAFAEDRDLAMKILFYARDVRGGLGERRVFRVITNWLASNATSSLVKNLKIIPEYGRWDDLITLFDTSISSEVLEEIKKQLADDKENSLGNKSVSLLGKWMPSINATSPKTIELARKLARALGLSSENYRHMLTALRQRIHIIENNLRLRDYTFDYSKQPSKAMYKYRKAFLRNDETRYTAFINAVSKGEVKIHTDTLTPYDIVAPIIKQFISNGYWRNGRKIDISDSERTAMNTTWNALEDFTNDENALVVVDGSGSMYHNDGTFSPAAVAESLAIYFAEHNKGEFHNHFITFSERPKMVEIKGSDIVEKLLYCIGFNEVANTNVEAVFNLILDTAISHNLPQKELPATLYFISDMEFDYCTRNASKTNFQNAKERFEAHGYNLPTVVFWNVDSRNIQQPVSMNEQGVLLVSGSSPRIFSMIKAGIVSPYKYMLDVLNSERYKNITA